MKKLLCFVFVTLFFFGFSSSVHAYSNTGYALLEDIEILHNDDVYLLINTSLKTRKENLKKVKWRFFGASVYTKVSRVPVKYKKFDSFSRSNKTNNVLEYDYTYKMNLTSEISTDVSSNLSAGVGAKIKLVDLSIEESIKQAVGFSSQVEMSKEVNYTITIDPHTKVTMYITGDALLSQGAVKYYVFGIPIYQSNWEYIDIVTEYYEFYEEIYK